jgi:glycogen operon protein
MGGSGDLFKARAPWASVNYVDCHDGFTMRDVYTYDAKQNAQAFPFGPSPGGDDGNDSWSQNGDLAAQHKAARTGLSLAALAAGVPMIAGGDEMFRTQYGDNNAYNLDTSKNWLDWSLATSEAAFASYARGVLRFRGAHPALRPAAFWTGSDHDANGIKDSTWLTAAGTETNAAYLGDSTQHFLATRIDGSEGQDAVDSIYVAYDAGTTSVTATLPATAKSWWLAGDSNASTFVEAGSETKVAGTTITVAARSVVVLVER